MMMSVRPARTATTPNARRTATCTGGLRPVTALDPERQPEHRRQRPEPREQRERQPVAGAPTQAERLDDPRDGQERGQGDQDHHVAPPSRRPSSAATTNASAGTRGAYA